MAEEISFKVKLIANDGKTFELEQDVAFKSQMIKEMCGNLALTDDFEVPVTEVDGKTLEKIIEYCVEYRDEEYKKRRENDDQRIDLTEKQIKFLEIDDDFLLELLKGANFLDIPGLIDIITQTIANMIKGMNCAQIREKYGLEDDLTEAEKEEVRKSYEWLDI